MMALNWSVEILLMVNSKKINVVNSEGLFLDIFINIESNNFSKNLLGKRNVFPFATVTTSRITSNIPFTMVYAISVVKNLGIAIVARTKTNFITAQPYFYNNQPRENVNTISKT